MAENNGISSNQNPDPGGGYWEGRLTPYVEIGGVSQTSPSTRANANSPSGLNGGAFPPVKRFTCAVAPVANTEYPNSGDAKWMISLDSEQLYTMSDQRVGVTQGSGFTFGKPFEEPTLDDSKHCYEAFGVTDGAYASPVPVQGLPIEFRKVYFRGVEVDEFGCTSGSGASGATYYAYMPCSLPVKQTCASGTGASGYVCNPRNENYGIMSGEVVDWSGFDIGVGGGAAGGCSTSISQITGSSGFCSGSGFIAQGCDQVLEFKLDGCLTGSGRLEGGPVQFSGCVTPSGSTGIVTYTLNPNLYSAVSGSGDGMCFASGCNSTLAFKTSGCLTGSGVASEDSQFKTIIECDSGANASIVTFVANPDLYQKISGADTVCTPSGCDSTLAFELSGCLTGNNQFSHDVSCDGNLTTVTFGLEPDIYQIVSGNDTACTPSGCDSVLSFDVSGCLTGNNQFSHDVSCDGNLTTVTFGLEPDIYQIVSGNDTACTPSGCDSVLSFDVSGCLTGNNRFSHDVACEGNITTVTFSANPDIYSVVSGGDSAVTASGCDSVLSFEASGCNPDFGVSVLDKGGGNTHVVFSLTGEACSGSGLGGSGITGAESIGNGHSIVSGVEDRVAYFNSITGGDNIEVTVVDNTLFISGVSGGAGSGITGVESAGEGISIVSGVENDVAYFNSISGGDNITVTLENNMIAISGGGGCASGYSNIKVASDDYPAAACNSIIEFAQTGCLGLASETITDGVKISFGLDKAQVLSCLNYYEKDIEICEGGSTATYTFLVKGS